MARRFYLLPVLAGVAVLTIAVRLPQTLSTVGDFLPGTAQAIAAEPAAAPPAEAPPAHPPAAAAAPPAAPAPGFDPNTLTAGEVDVLQNLGRRRAEIEARARELDGREALIAAAEARVDQKLAELKAIEARIATADAAATQAEDAQLARLVKVYETMKPAEAAGIFNTLDFPVLLQVASRMKETKIAPVLAAMDPQAAKALTVALATRKIPVPPVPAAAGNAG
jgi:flagellar motility protein MotE (MotC chaperone)